MERPRHRPELGHLTTRNEDRLWVNSHTSTHGAFGALACGSQRLRWTTVAPTQTSRTETETMQRHVSKGSFHQGVSSRPILARLARPGHLRGVRLRRRSTTAGILTSRLEGA